jgi:peptidoglycan/xylan/chitin deacetylase (PgdA/CDA1 family)
MRPALARVVLFVSLAAAGLAFGCGSTRPAPVGVGPPSPPAFAAIAAIGDGVAPAPRGPLDLRPTPGLGPIELGLGATAPEPGAADPAWAEILAQGGIDAGEVTFTFDDGPAEEPWLTPEVLRLLRDHRVRGTFFLTGSRLEGRDRLSDARREVARRIAREGHLLGNHALDHRDLSRERRGEPWIRREIERSAELIEATTGVRSRWFRPPYGKLGPTAQALLRTRGDELVLWAIDGQDVTESDPERLARRLCGQLQFAGQGIVLLHDLRPSSVQALGIVLQWLERHRRDPALGTGFSIVDLPTFLAHAALRPHREGREALYQARLARMHAALGDAGGRAAPRDARDAPDALEEPDPR